MGKAGDETLSDGIRRGNHDDRDRSRRLLYGVCSRSAGRHDHVQAQAHQFICERRESLGSVLPVPALDGKVLPFDPTEVPKSLKKDFLAGHGVGGPIGSEKAELGELSGLLRLASNADGQDQNDQSELDHSFVRSHLITLSARASTFGGNRQSYLLSGSEIDHKL